jgi:hypothetical protein
VTTDVLTTLSSQIDDLHLALQDSFDKRLTLLHDRVQATLEGLTNVNVAVLRRPSTPPPLEESHHYADAVGTPPPPIEPGLPLSPTIDETWDPLIDDEEEDMGLHHEYNLHQWRRPGMDERVRFHPTEKPFEFPSSLQVGLLFENWHKPDLRNPAEKIPPWKAFRAWDMSLSTEKTYYKAKAVVTKIVEYARKVGAVPPRVRISNLSIAEMQAVCNVGIQSIIEGHNVWLRKVAADEGKQYKEFKPRKLLTMSYATMAKYLHRNELQ